MLSMKHTCVQILNHWILKVNHYHPKLKTVSYTKPLHHYEKNREPLLTSITNIMYLHHSSIIQLIIKTSLFKPKSWRRLHWHTTETQQDWLNLLDILFIKTLVYVHAFFKAYPHVYALFRKKNLCINHNIYVTYQYQTCMYTCPSSYKTCLQICIY